MRKGALRFSMSDKNSLKKGEEKRNRFDILCTSKNFIIIVETKIGSSIVSEDQRNKYIYELKKHNNKNKILVQITQFNNQKAEHDKDITIINILWLDILRIIKSNKN